MNVQDPNSVIIQFGKKGVSEEFIKNIKKNLANNKLVKVKFLKSALEPTSRKELSNVIMNHISGLSFEHKLVGNVLFLKRIKN
jgi:RNA-binding protein YhbY